MYIARLWVSFSCDFSMVWVSGAGSSYIFEGLIPYRQESTLQGCGFHFPVISQWFGCLGQGQVTFLVAGFIFL